MKKIFNSRALALILVLAMAVSLFTISASAATSESLSGHGSNISTITATGVNYETVEYATSTDPHGTIYDYYLAVPAETANGTELTVAFTPAANVSSNFVISKFGANVPNPPQGINYISINSSADYLYVNGVQITGTSASNPYTVSVNLAAGETATYQVITQTGTRQPYIEVIKLTGSVATRSMSIGE